MSIRSQLFFLFVVTLTASAQTEKPLTSFPYTPGLDVSSMDKTVDPCVDFYQYSCGGWMKNNPIPGDQARWSVYGKLYQDVIVNKIGYPDKWRDYSSVQIKPSDFFGNVQRAAVFESRRDLNKIGKPLDRGEWGMTPPPSTPTSPLKRTT